MIKYLFLFVLILCTYACAVDHTHYVSGVESTINGSKTRSKQRIDTVYMGANGGFAGCTIPSSSCKVVYINLAPTADTAAANTLTSLSSYPATVKEIWIQGNATGFAALVQNGRQFALPTPPIGATVRFDLTTGPEAAPLAWFQDDLPGECWLSVEPGSADPFINTVLPLKGGTNTRPARIFIGSRVTPDVGFSDLLASASSPIWIQRHPNLTYSHSYSAPLVLQELTIFPGHVNGISFDWIGEPRAEDDNTYLIRFSMQSDIADPTDAAGQAGFFIASSRLLQIYNANKSSALPVIFSGRGAGGYASVEQETESHPMVPQNLPVTSFPTY